MPRNPPVPPLRLEREAWSTVKRLRKATNEYAPAPPSPPPLRTYPLLFTRFHAADANHLCCHTGPGRCLDQEFSPSNCGLSESPHRNGGPPPVRGACVSVVPQDSSTYIQIAQLFMAHNLPPGSGEVGFQNLVGRAGWDQEVLKLPRVGSGRVWMISARTGRVGSSHRDPTVFARSDPTREYP